MNTHDVFEKWKHLDHLVSDREWLAVDENGNKGILMMILYESWQAIKKQMIETRIDSTPLTSCHDCMWNYEGECNLRPHSGFHYDYDRYEDDEAEHEFKPCKYRLEYYSFEEWFLEHYGVLLK